MQLDRDGFVNIGIGAANRPSAGVIPASVIDTNIIRMDIIRMNLDEFSVHQRDFFPFIEQPAHQADVLTTRELDFMGGAFHDELGARGNDVEQPGCSISVANVGLVDAWKLRGFSAASVAQAEIHKVGFGSVLKQVEIRLGTKALAVKLAVRTVVRNGRSLRSTGEREKQYYKETEAEQGAAHSV